MSSPLISIALCTYNGARFLREQIDSLISQDYAPLEIVVVDDGSTDATVAILDEYRRRDARITVHHNPENIGFRRNFERALDHCRGTYIATCDQDDIWLPTKLTVLQAAIGESLLAYCDSELIDEHGRSLALRASGIMNMYAGSDSRVFALHNCVSGHAMLLRRELVAAAKPFPTCGFHDWWLAFVAASISRVVYVDQPLVRYRRHSGVQSSVATAQAGVARGRQRALRNPGEIGQWLAALQRHSSAPARAFFDELCACWGSREQSFLTPDLWWLMFRNRNSLFFVPEASGLGRVGRSLRYLWGGKAKSLFSPRKYLGV